MSQDALVASVQENDSGGGAVKGNLSKKGALKLMRGVKLKTTVSIFKENPRGSYAVAVAVTAVAVAVSRGRKFGSRFRGLAVEISTAMTILHSFD